MWDRSPVDELRRVGSNFAAFSTEDEVMTVREGFGIRPHHALRPDPTAEHCGDAPAAQPMFPRYGYGQNDDFQANLDQARQLLQQLAAILLPLLRRRGLWSNPGHQAPPQDLPPTMVQPVYGMPAPQPPPMMQPVYGMPAPGPGTPVQPDGGTTLQPVYGMPVQEPNPTLQPVYGMPVTTGAHGNGPLPRSQVQPLGAIKPIWV